MKKQKAIPLAVAVLAGTAVLVSLAFRPMNDVEIRAALVGRWRALDLSNAALHHRSESVAGEEVAFGADGTLTYSIRGEAGDRAPQIDQYQWEIVRGKLQLRSIDAGSTSDLLPRISLWVRGDRLGIRRRGFPSKEFERVGS